MCQEQGIRRERQPGATRTQNDLKEMSLSFGNMGHYYKDEEAPDLIQQFWPNPELSTPGVPALRCGEPLGP